MMTLDVPVIVVYDGKRLVGMITDRDWVSALAREKCRKMLPLQG